MNQENQKNEWSNPTAAGLVALSVACFCFFAMLTGRVSHDATPLVACWLLGGFIIQFFVAIMDLKGQNHAGGNTFLYFSAFFMFVGGIEMFLKFQLTNKGILFDAHVDGWAWVVLTVVTILWTPAFFKNTNTLLFPLIILAMDISLPFITLMDLGILSRSYAVIPAWGFLIGGVMGIYLSSAMVVNTAYSREIYPLPGPFQLFKEDSVSSELAS